MNTFYQPGDLTFVIPAYGESPYLESCIRSLLRQTVHCAVLIATSTPNSHIRQLAEKYALPLHIRDKAAFDKGTTAGSRGIADDWNFAYSRAGTSLVTLAHQDDTYHKTYAETVLQYLNRSKHPLIAFTDYSEMRGDTREVRNRMLVIKRILLSPLLIRPLWSSVFIRRRILSFGSAICCPSVTLVKDNLPDTVFTHGFRSNIDWQAWERISKMHGDFVFCPHNLMTHRIHKDSATTAIIADTDRTREDLEMFQRFWPKPVAGIIEHFYQNSEKLNG